MHDDEKKNTFRKILEGIQNETWAKQEGITKDQLLKNYNTQNKIVLKKTNVNFKKDFQSSTFSTNQQRPITEHQQFRSTQSNTQQ